MSNRQNTNSQNSHGGLYFVVGALAVAVMVIGYFAFEGFPTGTTENVDIQVTTPDSSSETQNAPQNDSAPQSDAPAGNDQ